MGKPAASPSTGMRRKRRRGRADIAGLVSVIILGLLVVAALAAPWLTPYDINEGSVSKRLLPPLSPGHPLGTDALGRDVLTRIIYGARVSLMVGAASVLLAGSIGTVIGLLSGYFGGRFDRIVTRVIDAQLSFPFMVLALTLAAILGPSLRNIIVTLVVSSWVIYARLVRGEVLQEREREYVQAARAMGASTGRIAFKHLLPNLIPNVIVMASLEVGRLIIAEASISFLGYGIQPPLPSWGKMVAEGKDYLFTSWWLSALPGGAIALTTLCANLAGDWLRDRLGR